MMRAGRVAGSRGVSSVGSSRSEGGSSCRLRALPAVLAVLVTAATAATHWPVLSAGAVSLDDDWYLVNNRLVQNPGWGSVRTILGEVRQPTVPGYYEPLTVVSLMLDWARGGRVENLRPFHETSLVLHVLNTLLTVVALFSLLRAAAVTGARTAVGGDERACAFAAAGAGLLFGLHPMTVEPVALVAQRKVLLAAFFCLGSLVAYVRYARTGRAAFLWVALALYGLGLLSKPTSMPLPLLLLLLDFWPLRRLSRRALVEKAPFLVLGIASAIVTLLSCARTSGITLPGASSPGKTALTIGYVIAFYFGKVFWPGALSSAYPLPTPFAISNPAVWTHVLATCVLLVGAILSLRWTRAIGVGVAFFLLAIFPTLGAVGYTWVTAADKHTYLPLFGLVLIFSQLLAVGWGAAARLSRPKAVRAAGIVAVLFVAAAECAGTRSYLVRWADTEELHRYMLDRAPEMAVLHYNLGNVLRRRGAFAEARDCYRRAAELRADYAEARNNLAMELDREGRTGEALAELQEALRARPRYPEAENNLGMILARRGEWDRAAEHLTKAIELYPQYAEAYNNLGNVRLGQGRLDEAVAQYRRSLAIAPGSLATRLNLGIALFESGRADEAIAAWQEAVQGHPDNAIAHYTLGLGLERVGRTAEAVGAYRRALALSPGHGDARARLQALKGEDNSATHP